MSTVFNFVSQGVKVNNLKIKWDLYSGMNAEIDGWVRSTAWVNDYLTHWAKEAIEQRDADLWFKAADKCWQFGAYDTEPRVQFADLWSEAYGEDIY